MDFEHVHETIYCDITWFYWIKNMCGSSNLFFDKIYHFNIKNNMTDFKFSLSSNVWCVCVFLFEI